MKIRILILVAIISLFFQACKKIDDYEFTDEQKTQTLYYSYTEGDTLYFLKNNIDTIFFVVKYLRFQKAYKSYFAKIITESITITFNDSTEYYLSFIQAEAVKQELEKNISITFFGVSGLRDFSDEKINEFELNGVTYKNVYVYSLNNLNSKIYANEKYGIIKAQNDTISYTIIDE